MKPIENPILDKFIRKKIKAVEGYRFWEHYSKGFRTPCRDLLATDVSVDQKNNIIKAMSQLITAKRNRLLLKITGWPRLGFLSEVFDEAKFIHVIRDGRAVANSLVNVGFWQGWGGPQKWRWGPLSEAHLEEWNAYDQSFIVLAAIQWKILMDAAEEAKKHIAKECIINIKYEDLCAHPISSFKETAKFCGLEWNDAFEARLKNYTLKNTNVKYKHQLTLQQQQSLSNVLDGYLKKYNYLCSS